MAAEDTTNQKDTYSGGNTTWRTEPIVIQAKAVEQVVKSILPSVQEFIHDELKDKAANNADERDIGKERQTEDSCQAAAMLQDKLH